MQITDYLQTYTGLSSVALFGGSKPLVSLSRDGDGTVSIANWSVTNIVQPSPEQIAAALKQPDAPSMVVLLAYAQYAQTSLLTIGNTFNVASSGSAAINILCDGLQSTRSDLALLALYGQANPTGTKTWIDNKGTATTLSGTQLVTLATLAGNWISNTYPALQNLIASIESGSITTTAQIDSFAWPTS